MGCNAWNHPLDCDCGFRGGHGHGNYSGGSISKSVNIHIADEFYANYWAYDRRTNYESYVNPNARCPVCHKAVFFYQSPYGGRVFFDELGPPWPKHPCTDNSSSSQYKPVSYLAPAKTKGRKIKWQEDGWEPVAILSSIVREDITILKIQRIDSDGMKIHLSAKLICPLNKDTLALIRETGNLGVFEISYIDTLNIGSHQVMAFRNCYTPSDFASYKGALAGNVFDQNKIAGNILFLNEEERVSIIDLNNREIDFDAARHWLDKAVDGNYNIAVKNLRVLDTALLKSKFEGYSILKIEKFNFEGASKDTDDKNP